MNRGLSLVEMLVALSLLGALMLALVSWTRLGLGSTQTTVEHERWNASAEAVLQLVQDDLLSGDFPAPSEEPRVECEAGELHVRTRRLRPPGGVVLREYALDPVRGRLTVRERAPTGSRSASADLEPTILLEHVRDWSCTLDEEEARLEVKLRSADGTTRERVYALP